MIHSLSVDAAYSLKKSSAVGNYDDDDDDDNQLSHSTSDGGSYATHTSQHPPRHLHPHDGRGATQGGYGHGVTHGGHVAMHGGHGATRRVGHESPRVETLTTSTE